MARTYYTLFMALLVLFNTQDMRTSAQMGTVQNALFDYIRSNSGPQPTNTQQQPQPSQQPATAPPPAASAPNTLTAGGMDLASLFTNPQPAATNTQGSSTFMDLFASSGNSAAPQQPAQPTAPMGTGQTGTATKNNPMDFYNQLMQVVNSPTQPQGSTQPQPGPLGGNPQPGPGTQPFSDPFTNSPQPNTGPAPGPGQTNQVQTQAPKLLPFVPPEWNLPPAQPNAQNPWAPNTQHGTTGWGHNSHHQGPTAWEQYYNPNHRPVQPATPPPHPMGRMMMIPRVRNMINKQATQFGDMAYYQQHGCVDPTPTRPGPGGIRPTQTLWYGCQSPVSKMVCTRAGQTAGGKQSSTMAMMMSMMNPAMARTFEKCLSPKMLTKMMFQGMSGGAGGMNPAMMMMMSGGGGGGMAGMLPMMMMMNQQNQAAGGMGGGMGGGMAGGNMGGGMAGGMAGGNMAGGMNTGMGGATNTGLAGGSSGGLNPTSVPATASPSISGGSKGVYKDPNAANTLISQAARIPVGAAQPQQQAPSNPFTSLFSGMLGGGANTAQSSQPASNLPVGAASAGSGNMAGGSFGQQPQEPDCSAVMPLVMSRVMAAGEGFASPEAQEAIGELRKQYLPYSCQELRIKYTGLPLRLCCPGRVDPPTIFDLFRAKSAGGA